MTGKQKLANLDKAPELPPTKFNVNELECFGIPVSLVRFPPTEPQDLYGKNGCSSVSSNQGAAKRSMHTIDFLPKLNQFRIVFHGQAEPMIDMVGMHRVNGWTPFEAGQSYTIPGAK